jgi:hypothetical protein
MKNKALLVLLIFAFLVSACSARNASTQTSNVDMDFARPEPAKSMDEGYGESYEEMPAAAPQEEMGVGGNYATVERLVIKNATLTIVVVDPLTSLTAISAMAEEMGGYVVTSYSYKTTLEDGKEVPEASVTIRVPAEELNKALDQIKALVRDPKEDVLNENVSGQDVTQEYTDLKSRLRNQEDAETQLREIMASATKTEDVLNTFNQLTYIREQIEVLKGQIQYYEESAAMSAVSVTIKAEESVQPLAIGGWQPVGVARDAIQALINALKFLVNAVIWIVLFALPIFILIYLPLRFLWKGFRKMLNNRKNRQPQAPPPASAPPVDN